jgi:hypothetical protein
MLVRDTSQLWGLGCRSGKLTADGRAQNHVSSA